MAATNWTIIRKHKESEKIHITHLMSKKEKPKHQRQQKVKQKEEKVEKDRRTATYNTWLRNRRVPDRRSWYAPLAISRC